MQPSKDRNPLAGEIPEMLASYGAETSLGRNLRKGDAKRHLKRMQEAEANVAAQENLARQIEDRIARSIAEHELNMQYLIEFGVSAAERSAFWEILSEVIRHGGLTLKEAAQFAHAELIDRQSRNGEDGGGESSSSSSSAA